MDFWISSLLGLVITLLCFLFWSIISNMYPDDFNISSSELCSLVWSFLAWWGNKGVIKLFLLVYATFVSGKYHLDI